MRERSGKSVPSFLIMSGEIVSHVTLPKASRTKLHCSHVQLLKIITCLSGQGEVGNASRSADTNPGDISRCFRDIQNQGHNVIGTDGRTRSGRTFGRRHCSPPKISGSLETETIFLPMLEMNHRAPEHQRGNGTQSDHGHHY